MNKLILYFFLILFIIPAKAGEYENALTQNNKTFLYLYSNDCSYCTKFEPVYKKLMTTYSNDYNFVKINTNTPYGRNLAYKLQVQFIPFVLLTNPTKNETALVAPKCITNLACAQKVLKEF